MLSQILNKVQLVTGYVVKVLPRGQCQIKVGETVYLARASKALQPGDRVKLILDKKAGTAIVQDFARGKAEQRSFVVDI